MQIFCQVFNLIHVYTCNLIFFFWSYCEVNSRLHCWFLMKFVFCQQMYTPLHASSASGQVSVIKLLLELGVEVDAVNVLGNTALHVSCLNGQDVVVSELLSYGASINALNHRGMVRFSFIKNDWNSNVCIYVN